VASPGNGEAKILEALAAIGLRRVPDDIWQAPGLSAELVLDHFEALKWEEAQPNAVPSRNRTGQVLYRLAHGISVNSAWISTRKAIGTDAERNEKRSRLVDGMTVKLHGKPGQVDGKVIRFDDGVAMIETVLMQLEIPCS
jgi:hypothetical protein